mgnify:CR=1 FL=1
MRASRRNASKAGRQAAGLRDRWTDFRQSLRQYDALEEENRNLRAENVRLQTSELIKSSSEFDEQLVALYNEKTLLEENVSGVEKEHYSVRGLCDELDKKIRDLRYQKEQTDQLGQALRDRTTDTAMIAVQGPKAIELSAGLFDVDIAALKYYFAAPTLYCRHPCVVSRTGYTGEDGFEVIVPNELAVTLWEELVGRGALPCGLGARDTLRLEAAMPLYGHELSEQTDPIQAGLGWAIKFDKSFLGRDAIQAADPSRPVRVGLALDGKRAAREGSAILADGQQVGTVTSGSFAPTLDRPIAMGYVPPAYNNLGRELTIDIRGTPTPAQIVALPFYKRAK